LNLARVLVDEEQVVVRRVGAGNSFGLDGVEALERLRVDAEC
jgi:hypothetical protein